MAGDEVSVQEVAFSDEYVSVAAPPAEVRLLGLRESVAVGEVVDVGGGGVPVGGVFDTATSQTVCTCAFHCDHVICNVLSWNTTSGPFGV
jgi:hypothetical protein